MTDIILSKQDQLSLQILEDLNKPRGIGKELGLKTRLHASQIEDLKPLYKDGVKNIFLACGRKYGKDIALTEPVLTPSGWKPIKDIHDGDYVISGKGIPTKVNIESPIYTDHVCYEVHFQDGTKIVAGEDHKWEVGNKRGNWKVLQTKELNKNWYRTKLPIIKYENRNLPIDPYLLGLWLGDGSSYDGKFTTIDKPLLESFLEQFELGCKDGDCTYYIKGLKKELRKLDLLKNKHIPSVYMTSSVDQRLELLRGLMDTDGYVNSKGVCEFVQKNPTLFDQVVELARSLGIRVQVNKPKLIKEVPYFRFHTSANKQIFKLERKAKLLEPYINNIRRQYKNIVKVVPCETVPTKCIGVECDSHTFITRNYTVTHNTELAGYVLWRQALLVPGSECFYITPEAVGGRKIIWEGGRLQKFLGKDADKYIDSIRNQDMTIRLKNGSYIQVVGSDNYMIANGLTPSIAVYDEFKGFNYRWHVEFAPNRVVKDAPFVFIGTKPRAGNKNIDQYNEILEYGKTSDKWYVAERTTFDNPINALPHIRAAIDEEIAQLRARGEEDVVQLEYYSKVIPGGKRAIFPMLDKNRHVKPHAQIMHEIKNDIKKLDWFTITDPGSTTCHATLFAAINPYTRKIYITDEIYETEQKHTSTRKIYPRMDDKMMEFYPNSDPNDDWIKVHDEAAAWFSTEVLDQYGVYFMPTAKHLNKKEHGLSLIKDLLLHDLVVISDRCQKLFWEMETYAKDEKGNIPKKHDHLIDCLRYLLAAANYSMVEVLERRKKENDFKRGRHRRLEDDPYFHNKENDWTNNIGGFDWG